MSTRTDAFQESNAVEEEESTTAWVIGPAEHDCPHYVDKLTMQTEDVDFDMIEMELKMEKAIDSVIKDVGRPRDEMELKKMWKCGMK